MKSDSPPRIFFNHIAAPVVLAVILVFALATVHLKLSEVSSLTPVPSQIGVYELKLTDVKGQARQSFIGSESVHLNMLARNYDPELDANAVMIVQVKGLEDNIVYHLDWKHGRYPYPVEVKHIFEIPPLGQSGRYFVAVHIWSNFDNPELAGDSTGSLLTITS